MKSSGDRKRCFRSLCVLAHPGNHVSVSRQITEILFRRSDSVAKTRISSLLATLFPPYTPRGACLLCPSVARLAENFKMATGPWRGTSCHSAENGKNGNKVTLETPEIIEKQAKSVATIAKPLLLATFAENQGGIKARCYQRRAGARGSRPSNCALIALKSRDFRLQIPSVCSILE